MNNFVPRLVRDLDTGKLCIQVLMGTYAATLELPDDIQIKSMEAIKIYMEQVVPEMVEGLLARKKEKRQKLMKDAQKV